MRGRFRTCWRGQLRESRTLVDPSYNAGKPNGFARLWCSVAAAPELSPGNVLGVRRSWTDQSGAVSITRAHMASWRLDRVSDRPSAHLRPVNPIWAIGCVMNFSRTPKVQANLLTLALLAVRRAA